MAVMYFSSHRAQFSILSVQTVNTPSGPVLLLNVARHLSDLEVQLGDVRLAARDLLMLQSLVLRLLLTPQLPLLHLLLGLQHVRLQSSEGLHLVRTRLEV